MNVSDQTLNSQVANTNPITPVPQTNLENDPAEASEIKGISEGELALQQRPKPDTIIEYDSSKANSVAKEFHYLATGVDPNMQINTYVHQPNTNTNSVPQQQPMAVQQPTDVKHKSGGLKSMLVGFILYVMLFSALGLAIGFLYDKCFIQKDPEAYYCAPITQYLGPLFNIEE
jgi:hypothetical protein